MLKSVLQRHNSQKSLNSEPNAASFTRSGFRSESMRLASSISFLHKASKPVNNFLGGSCQSLDQTPRSKHFGAHAHEPDTPHGPTSQADPSATTSGNQSNRQPFFKRYNSLTNILVNSFRKSKGKRRPSQIPETNLDRTVNESNPVFRRIVEEEPADYSAASHQKPEMGNLVVCNNKLVETII